MKVVIFAGGTGKRFWPVSRINSPKQFQAVTGDEPLLRKALNRVHKAVAWEDIFISTGKQYEHEVRELAPELPAKNFILEPVMRDSGPAVTLAAAYIEKNFPGEIVGVIWSDHLVKDEQCFADALLAAEQLALQEQKVVFVGVPARFPSPHRGYINFAEELKADYANPKLTLFQFTKFVEKPTVEIAMDYIASRHYCWNPGYWVAPAKTYVDVAARKRPDYADICTKMVAAGLENDWTDEFMQLEKISADFAFAELVESHEAYLLMADMGWSDVGEWIAIKEALENSKQENVVFGNVNTMETEDCLVYNYEQDKLVATIGLKGMVVVNTKDVVAIFSQTDNTKLKKFLTKLEEEGHTQYL